MKATIYGIIAVLATALAYPVFAQNSGTNVTKTEEKFNIDFSVIDGLSELSVIKLENSKFKFEDFDGIDVTEDIIALKTPNNLDLLFYDTETGVTSICYNFYDTEIKNNEWLDCYVIIKSPTGLYWLLSNNFKSFYIVHNGAYMDMDKFKLRANPSDKSEYIVQEDGLDKYVMKKLKGKNLDNFYPLEQIK